MDQEIRDDESTVIVMIATMVTIENQVRHLDFIELGLTRITQAHLLHVHNVTSERKSAANLLDIMLRDILHLHERNVLIIGCCSDAGGDSRAMRARLSALMPQLVVVDCYAHQVSLLDSSRARTELLSRSILSSGITLR